MKTKTGYKLELLSKNTQRLLRDGPITDEDKNSKNIPQLDQVEYVLLHCKFAENNYLQDSKLLYEFVPDKKVWTVNICKPPVNIQCKTSDTIFNYIEIWFTDQNNNSLQIENKVSVALIIRNNRLSSIY